MEIEKRKKKFAVIFLSAVFGIFVLIGAFVWHTDSSTRLVNEKVPEPPDLTFSLAVDGQELGELSAAKESGASGTKFVMETSVRPDPEGDLFYGLRCRGASVKVSYNGQQLLSETDLQDHKWIITRINHWYVWQIPEKTGEGTLRIEITFTKETAVSALPELLVGDQNSFYIKGYSDEAFVLVVSVGAIFMAVILIASAVVVRRGKTPQRMIAIAALAALIMIWLLAARGNLELFFGKRILSDYLFLVSFYLIPIALMLFLMTYQVVRECRYMQGLLWGNVTIFILVMVLSPFVRGLSTTMMFTSPLCDLLAFVGLMYICGKWGLSYRKLKQAHETGMTEISQKSRMEFEREELRELWWSTIIFSAFTVIGNVYYWTGKDTAAGVVFGLGLFAVLGYVHGHQSRQMRSDYLAGMEKEYYKDMSERDHMTGLYNRTAFETCLEVLREQPKDKVCCLLVADVNNLKYVNDNMGHAMGDDMLITASGVLRECFGRDGKVYRIGGDEFCVVSRTQSETMHEHAEEFRRRVAETAMGKEYPFEIAYGYVQTRAIDVDEALKLADRKMYLKKKEQKEKRTSSGKGQETEIMGSIKDLAGCRILLKDLESGKKIADTKITGTDSEKKLLRISANSIAIRENRKIVALVFARDGLQEYTGTLRKTVIANEMEVALGTGKAAEKRRFGRYPYQLEGKIEELIYGTQRIRLRRPISMMTQNISASGLLMRTYSDCFEIGDRIRITLQLKDTELKNDYEVVRIEPLGKWEESYGLRQIASEEVQKGCG